MTLTTGHRTRSWRLLVLSAVTTLLLTAVPATQASPSAPPDARSHKLAHHLVAAVVARLDVMPSVAYTKFRLDIPVNDPVREAAAEKKFVDAAHGRGVPRAFARVVILAQFSAAKQVQRRLIRQWRDGRRPIPTRPPADLATRLRPRIDAATDRLLGALAAYVAERPVPGWRRAIARAEDRADRSLRPTLVPRDVRTALGGVRGT